MREILFRGKNAVYGEWVEGFLVKKADSLYEGLQMYFILRQDRGRFGMFESGMTWIAVKPETVGQYTGLTDKDGKKIFEGDIVKAKLESGNFKGFEWPNMKVGFKDGAFCLIDNIGRIFAVMGAFAPNVNFEVVGNFYEKPELLEVKYNDRA